ncbi:6-phosphogluconolactonase [Actibacterium sp. 188UL27-1]|uniref:6-phosphogluconolactonase n=1 Tax=Actibacterium sp. 188UL27-1 TaxID=2786961 RepID=UPI0019569514|nr:6-phosphogluconolactonase [Actibacterium sp. 188UL27-1]MBM7069660.1 6-phosphogluconolactonase [Actibacterium sp. 188UL27-1]
MKLIEYADRDMMMIDLADTLAGELKSCLLTHDRASFSVPGGTTPGPVFDTLSGVDLQWSRISVFLNDERWVPQDHARSNARLVRERLLVDKAVGADFLPFYDGSDQPETALPMLKARIDPLLPISVLLLGMGADLHTASLFPGADLLEKALSSDAPPVMALRADAAGEPRLTLTAPVLKGALSTHVVITGREKRDALEAGRHAPVVQAPVRTVLDTATVHWAE